MTKTEVLELVRNGESSGVEFKRDDIDNRAFAKELVALANLAGGCLLLGVEDDGSISGVSRADLEEWVMTACRDKVRPEIIPYFEIVRDVAPGKDVAAVSVERGWGVHCVWHGGHRAYYIRVGSQSREASPEELGRLFQQRGAFRLEIRPVSGSSQAALDHRRLRDYFARVRDQDVPEDDDFAGWQTLLVNTEILAEQPDVNGMNSVLRSGQAPATVAGLLLFGTASNRFLPQAGIECRGISGPREGLCRSRAQRPARPHDAAFTIRQHGQGRAHGERAGRAGDRVRAQKYRSHLGAEGRRAD